MGLVTEAARERGFPSHLATVAERLYVTAGRSGLGRLDDSSIITLYRGG